MTLLDVSATGEENVLDVTSGDMNDLDYRRKQLQQMQQAAPTMEDLAGGLSITDLTLSDFRMDAAARARDELQEIAGWPLALFGVSRFDKALADDGLAPGAVFLLRVRDDAFAFSEGYPLAPYVLAYVTDDAASLTRSRNPSWPSTSCATTAWALPNPTPPFWRSSTG